MSNGFTRLNIYSKLAIVGMAVLIIGTNVGDFITNVIRHYKVRGEIYTQTYGDLIYYISIDICLLLWAVAIRHKTRFEKLIRCVMQFAIDYFAWDIIFLCFTNPYEWNNSKFKIYGCSVVTFLVVYYFEYVSLAQFYCLSKVKEYYANFKNKRNGRKS